MELDFAKLEGTGNDFILIDNRNGAFEAFSQGLEKRELVRRVCDRKRGVGADGLILIEESTNPEVHFKWQFFNSDGSTAEMCGNGARCAARFAFEKGIAPEKMLFETGAGVIEASVEGRAVKVRLTPPKDLKEDLTVEGIKGHYINTGVPHFIVFVDRVDAVDVESVGRKIRYSELFSPAGTNVNFAEVRVDGEIRVRTYERGVEGETLACGTGAVASAIVSHVRFGLNSPVKVRVRSGEFLEVYFDRDLKGVFLKGKVNYVFDGKLRGEIVSE